MEETVTTSTTEVISSRATASEATRWGQLIFGIICMVMIANLQYGWTLFVTPIDQKYHWGRAAIQVAFTIFVLTETWLVPFEGYLIDKFGPRIMISGSGVLVAIAWVINSVADSLVLLYIGAAIGGIGAGVIYGGSVGNALKWFPDRRGLAAGLTAAGFGAGSALTVIPIANMIQSSGYEAAFLWFGLAQGIVVILVAGAGGRRGRDTRSARCLAEPARLQPHRSAHIGSVLRHVRHVRDGRRRRADGNCPACAHCQRLQDRGGASLDPGTYAAGTDLRVDDRPGAQRHLSAILRLGLRSYRS
jgi:MFS family permease